MVAEHEPDATPMTYAEYLALEETSEIEHEYVNGYVYAMSGSTAGHDHITFNIRTALDAHLNDGPCAAYGPNLRVRVSATIAYYPDAMVTCDAITDRDTEVSTPRLIVEVLSKSTESDDRGSKFEGYQTLATFEEYLLVNSQRRAIKRFRRTAQGLWIYQHYAPDETIVLETIGLTCTFATVYRRTSL